MKELMKKKIGTIIDDGLLAGIKQRAAAERRPLAGVIEDALSGYLGEDRTTRADASRALARFTAHAGLLPIEEIDEILEEDFLAS